MVNYNRFQFLDSPKSIRNLMQYLEIRNKGTFSVKVARKSDLEYNRKFSKYFFLIQINGVLQTNGQQNGVKNDEQRMAGNADIVKLVSEGTCTVKYAVKQEVNLTQMAI